MVKKIVERRPRSGRPSLGVTTSPRILLGPRSTRFCSEIHRVSRRTPGRTRRILTAGKTFCSRLARPSAVVSKCWSQTITRLYAPGWRGFSVIGVTCRSLARPRTGAKQWNNFPHDIPTSPCWILRMPVMDGIQAVAQICAERSLRPSCHSHYLSERRGHLSGASGWRSGISHQGCASRRVGRLYPLRMPRQVLDSTLGGRQVGRAGTDRN